MDESREIDTDSAGGRMHALMTELFPLWRSITGPGLRQTLKRLGSEIPLDLKEVPSGTPVFDWVVPNEWVPRRAHVSTLDGHRIIDTADSNLHLVHYSIPMDEIVPVAELRRHLHTLPRQPDLIPYRTGYYAQDWGFCLEHRRLETLTDPAYRVVIDCDLAPGHLTYGELLLPGASEREVLISCHSCHPSLANDNLSGTVVAVELARRLAARPRRLSWRFVFLPGTIGSIAWLAQNEDRLHLIDHGLVLTCIGDGGGFTYKQTRRGNAPIDRIAAHVLRHQSRAWRTIPFAPTGYDERQYGSPAFDLPVGCFMRSPNGTFPEYHTSADSLDFVKPQYLAESLDALWQIAMVIEGDLVYRCTDGRGEPQLGRRGLYPPPGQHGFDQTTLLWVLNLADGRHTLLEIAERANCPFEAAAEAATLLAEHGLITADRTGDE